MVFPILASSSGIISKYAHTMTSSRLLNGRAIQNHSSNPQNLIVAFSQGILEGVAILAAGVSVGFLGIKIVDLFKRTITSRDNSSPAKSLKGGNKTDWQKGWEEGYEAGWQKGREEGLKAFSERNQRVMTSGEQSRF